jgi:hypothetical protein
MYPANRIIGLTQGMEYIMLPVYERYEFFWFVVQRTKREFPRSVSEDPRKEDPKSHLPSMSYDRVVCYAWSLLVSPASAYFKLRELGFGGSLWRDLMQQLRKYSFYQFGCLWRRVQGGLLNEHIPGATAKDFIS